MPLSIVENIDCMEGMKKFPNGYFELAIVDPPYGVGRFDRECNKHMSGFRNDGTKRKNKSWRNPIAKEYDKKQWDYIPSVDYFNELIRISNHQIIWGGNYFTDYLRPHGGWVVWEKGVAEGMSLSQAELAWNSCLNSIKVVKILWAGYKKNEPTNRIHPTQKPIALYKWLLKNYAKQGDKILDTHLGSQSSRIAAYHMGFDFYGWEIDSEYFEAGNKRFKEQTMQLSLL